jgi:hypothetical protein
LSTAADVPLWRLYALRAFYLLITGGMGLQMWPVILSHPLTKPLMSGVADSLLGALALLTLLGVRYPLAMLPLMLFEMTWKAAWLLAFALPLWSAHQRDADTAETVKACLMAVAIPFIIPWPYVFAHYVKAPGDRWK